MTTPTDDELAAWYEGYFGATVYDGQACDDMRAAIEAPTREAAVKVLADREWCSAYGTNRDPLREAVKSLRKRFPRPIDEAVLRAEGFDRTGGEGTPYLLHAGRRLVIAQDMRDGVFEVQWSIDNDYEVIRTPDRLHEVVEHLKGLYALGENR